MAPTGRCRLPGLAPPGPSGTGGTLALPTSCGTPALPTTLGTPRPPPPLYRVHRSTTVGVQPTMPWGSGLQNGVYTGVGEACRPLAALWGWGWQGGLEAPGNLPSTGSWRTSGVLNPVLPTFHGACTLFYDFLWENKRLLPRGIPKESERSAAGTTRRCHPLSEPPRSRFPPGLLGLILQKDRELTSE